MRPGILLGMMLLFVACFWAGHATAQGNKPNNADMAAEVLQLVNKYRVTKGLPPLLKNDMVARAAAQHSADMGSGKIPFGHEGFDARMDKLAKQLPGAKGFAENVAYGAKTAAEAMDMWLHSQGHRENIEGNYNLTGIGIVKGTDGNLYFTEIFIKK